MTESDRHRIAAIEPRLAAIAHHRHIAAIGRRADEAMRAHRLARQIGERLAVLPPGTRLLTSPALADLPPPRRMLP